MDDEEWDSIMNTGDGEKEEPFVPMSPNEIKKEVNKMIEELE